MSEPTTKAGRALLDELTGALARRSILAIEREAVAQERARLRAALPEAIEDCDRVGWDDALTTDLRPEDALAAVLRLLDPEAEGGTGR